MMCLRNPWFILIHQGIIKVFCPSTEILVAINQYHGHMRGLQQGLGQGRVFEKDRDGPPLKHFPQPIGIPTGPSNNQCKLMLTIMIPPSFVRGLSCHDVNQGTMVRYYLERRLAGFLPWSRPQGSWIKENLRRASLKR
jgi:hypothetical protein